MSDNLVVVVTPDSVETLNKKDGSGQFHLQSIYIQLPSEPYPVKVKSFLKSAAEAYPPGDYYFDIGQSLTVRNERIDVRPVLIPIPRKQ